ncbi:methylthioribulose 1-phosphate dehydratase [Subtercola frigoramans]|uniref:Methylthioribulose-1-phosphate dehydratase n=1 Tax=Subtercola frigoramans TaxID=120298 RepID=A0ABS2L2X5_9MICO|nr:methylthioribulose 1-phosphate dehydratase [Subtercola frigoramans]MBM7471369.1 methylthioribulose-1-phosphate dehydratase [Subtercola frigoramans]
MSDTANVFSDAIVDHAVIREAGVALAAESRRFADRGWMPGTAGNLSVTLARDPLWLAVTASGLDKGELKPTDVVIVDEQGEWTPDAGLPFAQPSAEAGLHARIAAVTGAGAVIHVHALAAVRSGHHWPNGVVLHDLEMLKGIGHSAHDERVVIPVVKNHQDMVILGDAFERAYRPATEAIAEVPALIVADHGIYAWGRDLRQARWHLELTEALLQIVLATKV